MKRSAVIYDKWLNSFGGGEVVACSIANLLKDIGYDVTFVCGKKVSPNLVKQKLNANLSGIKIVENWNDESYLKKITKGKDLFVNVSYMDYSLGFAKNNIYYTHFPTQPYDSIKGLIANRLTLPLITKFIKPMEFMTELEATTVKEKTAAFILQEKNRIAFFYLNASSTYTIEFRLFIENFYQSLIETIGWSVDNAVILDKNIMVDHDKNVISIKLKVKVNSPTIYFNLNYSKLNYLLKEEDDMFVLYPKIFISELSQSLYRKFLERLNRRLRAGIFINILQRLKTYQIILANSYFTQKWVLRYWKRESIVLFPPVEMFFKKNNTAKIKKENIICSVGRFFTLGHGKKQEVLIAAFKKLYDKGYKDWRLCLVGGLGNEPTSLRFAKKLQILADGYPIEFYFNATRKEVEKIYRQSKIYWHAAGINENESEYPIRFEHFGIAPIEGISAGCIPILFNGGGLREIIRIAGFGEQSLYSDVDELVQNTIYYLKAENSPNWEKIFLNIDNNFSLHSFENKFKRIIATLS